MNSQIRLIRAHETALDRVLRANSAGKLMPKHKRDAIAAGLKCGLSLRESENFLREAMECSK